MPHGDATQRLIRPTSILRLVEDSFSYLPFPQHELLGRGWPGEIGVAALADVSAAASLAALPRGFCPSSSASPGGRGPSLPVLKRGSRQASEGRELPLRRQA